MTTIEAILWTALLGIGLETAVTVALVALITIGTILLIKREGR